MKPPTLETETTPLPVSRSEAAEASSAHARLNIPLNLSNWRSLPEEISALLMWFHQHALDTGMTLKECATALGYDNSVVFRVLKGTYEGNWQNIGESIRSYRKLIDNRGTIQKNEFVHNTISKLIWAGLDYCLANKSITTITGESRQGKTVCADAWQKENNHGRSVFITAPAYGGTKALLREICHATGNGKNLPASSAHEAILRAFNPTRILIVDEAHRLLPGDRRCNPTNLEILRDLHDRAGDPKDPREKRGCALALLSTRRFGKELQKGEYMFEQLLGRIGMPIRLPQKFVWTAPAPQGGKQPEYSCEIAPIVTQYVRKPSEKLVTHLLNIANNPGRLGILVETLKVASRIAKKKNATLAEEHIFAAIKLREQMMGIPTP